jgi:hypothetical protein
MIIVGFVLLVASVVVAVALIVQNPATVTVHAFNQSWNVDMRWMLVAGLALTAIGLLGFSMMRLGTAHYLRLSGERRSLAAENRRLHKRAAAADTAPRTAPSAQSAADRRSMRERLAATRLRLARPERAGQTGGRGTASS